MGCAASTASTGAQAPAHTSVVPLVAVGTLLAPATNKITNEHVKVETVPYRVASRLVDQRPQERKQVPEATAEDAEPLAPAQDHHVHDPLFGPDHHVHQKAADELSDNPVMEWKGSNASVTDDSAESKEDALKRKKLMLVAAVIIQTAVRSRVARRLVDQRRQERKQVPVQDHHINEKAADELSDNPVIEWKGSDASVTDGSAESTEDALKRQKLRQEAAVIQIQTAHRSYVARRLVDQRRQDREQAVRVASGLFSAAPSGSSSSGSNASSSGSNCAPDDAADPQDIVFGLPANANRWTSSRWASLENLKAGQTLSIAAEAAAEAEAAASAHAAAATMASATASQSKEEQEVIPEVVVDDSPAPVNCGLFC